MVPRCEDCGDYNWVPYPACRSCLSERQAWTAVSGQGTVYSYTVSHRGPGAFDADVPYAIVLGELAERPRPRAWKRFRMKARPTDASPT